MDVSSVLSPECIAFDQDLSSKDAIFDFLIGMLVRSGAVSDAAAYKEAVVKREGMAMTGLQDGIAIPHGISDAVVHPAIAYVRLKGTVDEWESIDGKPIHHVFLLAIPTGSDGDKSHIKMLSALATSLIKPEVIKEIEAASSASELLGAFDENDKANE